MGLPENGALPFVEVLPGGPGVLRLESRTASIPDQAAPDSKLGSFIGRGITRKAGFFPAIHFERRDRVLVLDDFGNAVAPIRLGIPIDGGFESLLRNEFGNDLRGEERRKWLDTTSPAVFVSSSARRIEHCFAEADSSFGIPADPDEVVTVVTRLGSQSTWSRNQGETSAAKPGRG
jgi:hypothetical protein